MSVLPFCDFIFSFFLWVVEEREQTAGWQSLEAERFIAPVI